MDEGAVRRLIAEELAVDLDQVDDRAEFRRDLGADSLDIVSLTMRVEEMLDVEVPDDEAESCQTVGDAMALLRQKIV